MVRVAVNLILGILVWLPVLALAANQETYTIVIKDHQFVPAELKIPAGQKAKLTIENQDATPEEFESHDLNREKIVPGHQHVVVYIGPLRKGRYPYFGDFHPLTTKGVIIAE